MEESKVEKPERALRKPDTTRSSSDDVEEGSISAAPDSGRAYHIFSHTRKLVIVCIISIAGIFSPLSSNIYFPALDTIATELHAQKSLIYLTIATYMTVQGVATMTWGPWSDARGRRKILLFSLVIYVASSLAMCFTSSFAMLVVLRGVQAAGSSAAVAIDNGIIADIATPEERGGFVGLSSGIRMVGQAGGPVVGGVINSAWGFRSIFWLLFVLGSLATLVVLVCLPETHRDIAGDGSVPLREFWLRPWMYFFKRPSFWRPDSDTLQQQPQDQQRSGNSGNRNISRGARRRQQQPPLTLKLMFLKMVQPLHVLLEKDILALVLWGSLVYTIFSMTAATTSDVLLKRFPHLTRIQLGLCFLPSGLGSVVGSLLTGCHLDRRFARLERDFRAQHALPARASVQSDPRFPFERARLATAPWIAVVFVLATAAYGACLSLRDGQWEVGGNKHHLHAGSSALLAAPLALQFILAVAATAVFNTNSAMMVDCFPTEGAAAAAVSSFVRCTIASLGISLAQPIVDELGVRMAFVVMASVAAGFSPLVWVEARWGRQWRMQREEKRIAKAKKVEQGETPGEAKGCDGAGAAVESKSSRPHDHAGRRC